jgi:hypothetical protein
MAYEEGVAGNVSYAWPDGVGTGSTLRKSTRRIHPEHEGGFSADYSSGKSAIAREPGCGVGGGETVHGPSRLLQSCAGD